MRFSVYLSRALVFAGILACAAVLLSARSWPEKPGPGFDEVHYLGILENGAESLATGETPRYYASKSLPFLTAHFLFGLNASSELSGATAMLILNLLIIALSAYAVAYVLARRRRERYIPLALILFLVNTAILKFYAYYPGLPDVASLGLGAVFAVGHFTRKPKWIWVSLILGTAICPQYVLFAAAYLSFQSEDPANPKDNGPWTQTGWAALLGQPVLVTGLLSIVFFPEKTIAVAKGWINPKYFEHPLVLIVSALAAAFLLWEANRPLRYLHPQRLLRAFSWKSALAAAGTVAAGSALLAWSVHGGDTGGSYALRGFAISSSYLVSKPAPAVPSYLLFFGMGGALALLWWRSLARWIGSERPAFAFAFCAILALFGLNSEVRHVIFLFPILIVGICEVADRRKWNPRPAFVLPAAIALALTWMPFLEIDADYRGERMLTVFGLTHSWPLHLLAWGLTAAVLWSMSAYLRKHASIRD